MKKRKGLSLDEKRHRLMQIFFEKKEVMNLKELEKLAPKRGIVLQSVKDVLQSLCDDNLVDFDKIGSANFHWALPSKAGNSRNSLLEQLVKKNAGNKEEMEKLRVQNEKLLEERKDSDEREEQLDKLKNLKARNVQLQSQVASFVKNDPLIYQQKKVHSVLYKEAANRWTDNIFLVQQWIKQSQPDSSDEQLEGAFPILKNLDFIDTN